MSTICSMVGARGARTDAMKLTSRCYAVPGLACIPPWTHNAGFVVGDARTLVVDTGGNLAAAQTIHGYASAAKPGNALVALVAEPHLDHILGTAWFAEQGIEVLGHASIARTEAELAGYLADYRACIPAGARRERGEERAFFAGTRLQNPTRPIAEDLSLALGGVEVRILLTPGHTRGNVSAFVEEGRVLYCADCVVTDYLPNLEAGGPGDWRAWLDSLDRIAALSPEVLVPGHGRIARGAEVPTALARVAEVLRRAIAGGAPPT
jgi:glyoxylase-like metal-dependent hydrolase (beta-lactamase superfamily II)